jgi:hypothetical protein
MHSKAERHPKLAGITMDPTDAILYASFSFQQVAGLYRHHQGLESLRWVSCKQASATPCLLLLSQV